jgi:hypothetical protein
MGGKHLPSAAWLVFFAVCDEMSAAGMGRPEVWEFFREQCLACVKSTPDFSAVGTHMPLLEAMVAYASATEEMAQVGVGTRAVCRRAYLGLRGLCVQLSHWPPPSRM